MEKFSSPKKHNEAPASRALMSIAKRLKSKLGPLLALTTLLGVAACDDRPSQDRRRGGESHHRRGNGDYWDRDNNDFYTGRGHNRRHSDYEQYTRDPYGRDAEWTAEQYRGSRELDERYERRRARTRQERDDRDIRDFRDRLGGDDWGAETEPYYDR